MDWSGLPESDLHRYCLRLPREACFDQRRWYWVSAQKLFLMSLATFSSCVGAERVETMAGFACQRIGLLGTDCDSHVKRVLTWSDCTGFDNGILFFALFNLYFLPSLSQKKNLSHHRQCPLFDIERTVVAINSCTSPRSHIVPSPTTMGADPASAFFF